MSKPFSQACENNKTPILSIIRRYFEPGNAVLEIGSYTTQHIQHFAAHLPRLIWQPSDIEESLPIVQEGLAEVALGNILPPLLLDVSQRHWPLQHADGIFSANTLHIMAEELAAEFFRGAGEILNTDGHLCVYGPFKYAGQFTSDSNARFELWLKEKDPRSGIRDFEVINALAEKAQLLLVADHPMPANNQLLVWQKTG